ncbi:hypothetical protein LWI29_029562 [Acer saccharum]|uniref:HMA domain-containing protein n=1 Tax=Acer saccharum TaxID=4024 RepID=A0AA39S8R1_ACESA|nr:hypothetical protein LWI29_029562 [Acer saccharum]
MSSHELEKEVILVADLRCANCRDKVADAISRLAVQCNADVECMEVQLSKKKVILTVTSKEMPRKAAAAAAYKHDNLPRIAMP